MDMIYLNYNNVKFDFSKFFKKNNNIKNISHHLAEYSKDFLKKKIKDIKDDKKFIRLYKNFIKKEIQKLFKYEIVYQKLPNIRVLYPNDIAAVVPYHCDKWYNHSDDEVNFWVPLHSVSGTESLQIVSLKKSIELENKILKEKLSYSKINTLISKYAEPVKCDYGKVLKFSPLHLHGNVINRTKYPRISIDFRIKKLKSKFRNKSLGGYFDIIKK